jgi:hypothetical protein
MVFEMVICNQWCMILHTTHCYLFVSCKFYELPTLLKLHSLLSKCGLMSKEALEFMLQYCKGQALGDVTTNTNNTNVLVKCAYLVLTMEILTSNMDLKYYWLESQSEYNNFILIK